MGDNCDNDLLSNPPKLEQEVEEEQQQIESSLKSPSSPHSACQNEADIIETLDVENVEFHDPAIIEAVEADFSKFELEDERDYDEDQKEEDPDEDNLSREEKGRKFQYPLRPDEADCSFYLRTGTCRYGSQCRFNHPPRNKGQFRLTGHYPESAKDKENGRHKEKEEYPERAGAPECKMIAMTKDHLHQKEPLIHYQFYLKTGACKFGKACRYHHPREKSVVGPAEQFNFLGLPIRPGEKECTFYMRMGSCKFATNCRFHHPDPTDARASDPLSENHNGSVPSHSAVTSQPLVTTWSLPGASNGNLPYSDAPPSYTRMMPPSQGTQQSLEWNGYQVPASPLYQSEGSSYPPNVPFKNNYTMKADGSLPHQQQMAAEEFPERPGQRECQYFMKNGDCKYRSACRFHHPKNRLQSSPILSPMGLPLRPDQTVCSHYSHYGICKYGPACKYDHPLNIGSPTSPVLSASGPTSMH